MELILSLHKMENAKKKIKKKLIIVISIGICLLLIGGFFIMSDSQIISNIKPDFLKSFILATSEDNFYFEYSDVGFSRACSYYIIFNKGLSDTKTIVESLKIADKNDLGYKSGFKENVGKISNGIWEFKINESYNISVNDYGELFVNSTCDVSWQEFNDSYFCERNNKFKDTYNETRDCLEYNSNKTQNNICEYNYTGVVGSHFEERWRIVWKQLGGGAKEIGSDKIVIDSKDGQKVRYCANIKRDRTSEGWKIEIDHIPSYDNLDYPEFSWWNSSWILRKNITIDSAKVNGTQTNFPILINITDTDLKDDAQNDGDDIVFTNTTGSKLDYEIEYFDGSTGWLNAWVRIPSLSGSANTTIQMYYNNSVASNQENSIGVWDSGYVMVQHLDDGANTSHTDDSTRWAYDGVKIGANEPIENANGQIDGSQSFDGVDDTIDTNTASGTFFSSTLFTISAWVYPVDNASTTDANSGYLAGIVADSGTYVWMTQGILSGNDKIWVGVYDGNADEVGVDYPLNQWSHIVMTLSGGTLYGYKDGLLFDSVASGGLSSDNAVLEIGRNPWQSEYFNGTIDELRISNTSRSAGWINTSYANQNSPSTFAFVGSEETEPVVGDTCDCSSIQGGTAIDCSENCDIGNCDANAVDLVLGGSGIIALVGNLTVDSIAIDSDCNFVNIPNDGNWLMVKT